MKKLTGLLLTLACSLSFTACAATIISEKEEPAAPSQQESGSQQESASQQESSQSGPQETGSQKETSPQESAPSSENAGEGGSAQEGGQSTVEITPAAAEFLERMCFYLPEFDDPASLDEQFWHDFIFLSYTGPFGNEDLETVMVMREDLGFEEQEVKVSLEQVEAYVKLALGLELPDYRPAFEDMNARQTACYFKDGFYYIGVSDFPGYTFTFKDITVTEDHKIMAEVTAEFLDEGNVGSIYFELEPADNENGFIIRKKIRDIHFD